MTEGVSEAYLVYSAALWSWIRFALDSSYL